MNNVRRIRKSLFDVSQTEFGEIAGVTQATVSRWENGLLVPSLLELERIKKAAKKRGVQLTADDFFARAKKSQPQRASA